MKAKRIILNIVKTVIFLGIIASLTVLISNLLKPEDNRTKISAGGFRNEEKNSIDVMVVGSSTLYRYISPNLLWEEQGFTSYVYGGPGAPFDLIKSVCREADKTQNPDLIVVDARRLMYACESVIKGNEIYTEEAKSRFSAIVNNFPLGFNKIRAIMESKYIPNDQKLLYITEIGKYHGRWDDVIKLMLKGEYDIAHDLYLKKYDLKGYGMSATIYDGRDKYVDLTGYEATPKDVPEELYQQMLELFDYAKEADVDLLFVDTPYVTADENMMDMSAGVRAIVEANGYKYYEMNYEREELGLKTLGDYYDDRHTNARGARKVTSRIGEYISENYDINRNHTQTTIDEWNRTAKVYEELYTEADGILEEYEQTFYIEDEETREAELKRMKDIGKAFATKANPQSANKQ